MKWGHSHSVWKVNNNLVGYRKLLKTGSPIFNQFCGYAFRFISPRHPAMGPEISREKPLWFSNKIYNNNIFFLSCGIWDPVPWSGMEPRPSALGAGVLAIGPPGKSKQHSILLLMMWTLPGRLTVPGWSDTHFLKQPPEIVCTIQAYAG